MLFIIQVDESNKYQNDCADALFTEATVNYTDLEMTYVICGAGCGY